MFDLKTIDLKEGKVARAKCFNKTSSYLAQFSIARGKNNTGKLKVEDIYIKPPKKSCY